MGDLGSLVKKLVEGDILVVSERGLKHAVNRFFGRSKWHHVMLYIGKGKVLEVTPRKGCHISKLDLARGSYKAYKAVRCRKLAAETRRKIAAAAVKLFLGKKFDWKQLVKVFSRRLLDWKGNKSRVEKHGYGNDIKGLICSNLVAITYHMTGHAIGSKWAPEYIMPRDYDMLGTAGGFEVVFERRLESGRGKNAA
ncbi:hypothetical protein HYU16_04765 [Candidatus Woesearchaeota archaeon]|nr:hypothetical protein [Candidatus Woesearchaeota archaeon]